MQLYIRIEITCVKLFVCASVSFLFSWRGSHLQFSLARNLINNMKTSFEVFMFLNCSENVLTLEADKGVDPLAENCAEGDGQKMVSTSNLMIYMVMDLFILNCCLYIMVLVVKLYQGTQRGGKSRFLRKRGKVHCSKFTKKSSGYSSVRSRISVKKGELNHHYEPCGCKSACGKDCLCLLNRTHCEKYCGYALSCTWWLRQASPCPV